MTTFAQQLQQAREPTGLSQAKLAKRLNPPVPLKTYQKWEQGVYEPDPYKQAGILAAITELATSTPAK